MSATTVLDSNGEVLFQAHPGFQENFLSRRERTAGCGGSAGPGKTTLLLMRDMYALEFETQRWKRGEIGSSSAWCMYFRRLIPSLQHTIDRTFRIFPRIDPGAKWNAQHSSWTFSCGMKWQAGGMEQKNDWLKYYSAELLSASFDELTEFDEEQFDQLDSRIRTSDPALAPFMGMRWATNPVGPGLVWVRQRFVEIAKPGTVVRVRTKLSDGRVIEQDQIFLQAYLRDNPSLAGDGLYEASLRKNKPHIFRALFLGDWYVSSDGFLAAWWNPELHVCEDHPIPKGVFRFRSCDFGIHAWSSITWWYVDYDGAMTAYWHLYLRNLDAKKQAQRIREVEIANGDWDEEQDRSMLVSCPLDAQCFKRGGTSGPTIAQEFQQNGVQWKPSTKDRFNGLAEVVRRLDTYVDLGNGRKKPMVRYMKRCEKPRMLLPVIGKNPNDPSEVDPNAEDHCLDDLMFAAMSRPMKPRRDADRDDDDDDLDDLERFRRKRRVAALGRGNW